MARTQPDDPIAATLRAAADAATPAFSPALHATVIRAVRRETTTAPRVRRFPIWKMSAAAAVAVVFVGIAARRPVRPPVAVKLPVTVMSLPGLPPLPRDLVGRVDPIAREWVEARRETLDRTAERFGRFCLDRVDVFPTPPDGRRAVPRTLPS